jgi:hypothetical protein
MGPPTLASKLTSTASASAIVLEAEDIFPGDLVEL